jgi:N,N-dimethylformamidase beta subunit-like protein
MWGFSARGMKSIPGKCQRCSENSPFLSRTRGALTGRNTGPASIRVARRAALVLLLLSGTGAGPAPENPTAVENARPGTRGWGLAKPATNREIEGYASASSVAPGGHLTFHVSTKSRYFDIDVYRLGWYGGAGARRLARARGLSGSRQATPRPRAGDGLVDCGWPVSYALDVSSDWPSGIYLARLTGRADGKQAFIPFTVREGPTENRAPLLFQSPVTTWQAYNNWGGKSLYDFNSTGGARARRVSFDRPYGSGPGCWGGLGAGELLTVAHAPMPGGWEYPMLRWLERSGYHVAYATDLDVHRDPELLTGRRGYLIVGHDEYWSRIMRDRVEAARDRGTHIGIFAANVGYWQIRLESPNASGESRIMFCAKDAALDSLYDTEADADLTVRFRDLHPRRPEVALVGMMMSGENVKADFVPLPEQRNHWIYQGTGIARGTTLRVPGLVGYEVDRAFADDSLYGAWSPKGLTVLARAPIKPAGGEPSVTETIVYTAPSGAIVFAAGTMQWSWGLDDWGAPKLHPKRSHPDVARITRNVLGAFLRGSG